MKRTHMTAVRLLGIVALAALVFCGCDILDGLFGTTGVSITERIDAFVDGLNSLDRSQIYLNFHPTATTDYSQIKPAAYWEDFFPAGGSGDTSYAISDSTTDATSTPAVVTATMVGPELFGGPATAELTLSKDGSDWMIQGIRLQFTVGGDWATVVE